MSRVATATFDLEADKSSIGRSISGAIQSQGSTVGGLGRKLGGLFFGGFAAFKAVGIFKDSIGEAQEAAKVQRLTNAVLASTKGAANIGAEGVGTLAEKLSNLSGIDDELVQTGENVLLTFTNIKNAAGKGNDIFNQATQAALDFSASPLGSGDMAGAATMVGKALNDPIKGMTALGRAGVSFSQQQKDQVKALVESGHTLDAQKIILKEFNTEFGGAAAAAADPAQKLSVIWGNLEERLGGVVLPLLNTAATWLGNNLPGAIDKTSRALTPLIGGAKQVFDVLFKRDFHGGGPFAEDSPFIVGVFKFRDTALPILQKAAAWLKENWPTALKIAGAAFLLFTGPVTFIVAAIALLYFKFQGVRDFIAAAVRFIGEQFGHFRAFVQQVFPQVQEAIGHFVNVAKAAWRLFGDDILKYAKAIWSEIQLVIKTAVGIVEGIIKLVLAVINGDWGKAWDAIKGIVGTVWNLITGSVKNGIEAMSGVIGAALEGLGRLWGVVWSGFLSIVDSIWVRIQNAVRAGANIIIDALNLVIKAYNLLPGHTDIDPVAHLSEVRHTVDTGNNTGQSIRALQGGVGLAKGGNLSGWGTIDFVGEEGIELVSGNAHVTSNRDLRSMFEDAGRGVTVEVSNAIVGNNAQLAAFLTDVLDRHFKNGGAKPPWAA